MAKVESFELNHDEVKAPYVRIAGEMEGKKGDKVTKYDIRLVQPNENAIPTAALHTIEHLTASYLRDELGPIIDCSPMGCRTGFYLTTFEAYTTTEVAKAFTKVLEHILVTEGSEVPGLSRQSCGNYRDHSLYGAKEWAKTILEQGFSDDPFIRNVVTP